MGHLRSQVTEVTGHQRSWVTQGHGSSEVMGHLRSWMKPPPRHCRHSDRDSSSLARHLHTSNYSRFLPETMLRNVELLTSCSWKTPPPFPQTCLSACGITALLIESHRGARVLGAPHAATPHLEEPVEGFSPHVAGLVSDGARLKLGNNSL